MIIGSYKYLLF